MGKATSMLSFNPKQYGKPKLKLFTPQHQVKSRKLKQTSSQAALPPPPPPPPPHVVLQPDFQRPLSPVPETFQIWVDDDPDKAPI